MSDIFISYSHKDIDFAKEFELLLQGENFEVWMDHRIDFGTRWEDEILKAIKECVVFVILMSENSYQSNYVKNEINHAKALSKHIIPILLQGKPFDFLADIQHVDMTREIKLIPKFISDIHKKLKGKPSHSDVIRSLEYYIEELEKSLLETRNTPLVSDIIKYQKQLNLLHDSVEGRLIPLRAPIHIKRIERIDEIFSEWEILSDELHEYADQINDEHNEIKESVKEILSEWDKLWAENPDALELPSNSHFNDSSLYDGDLFSKG